MLRYSPQYYTFLANSTNVVFNNFDISGYSSSSNEAKNTDGWDTYRSSDITIMNSVINNGDGKSVPGHLFTYSLQAATCHMYPTDSVWLPLVLLRPGCPPFHVISRSTSNKHNLANTFIRLCFLQTQLYQRSCGVALVQRLPRNQCRLARPVSRRV